MKSLIEDGAAGGVEQSDHRHVVRRWAEAIGVGEVEKMWQQCGGPQGDAGARWNMFYFRTGGDQRFAVAVDGQAHLAVEWFRRFVDEVQIEAIEALVGHQQADALRG